MPVSDALIPCPIASLVSVGKRTDEIIDGSTLTETEREASLH